MAVIEEIIRSSQETFVLVCANSNTACDEITGRLSDILSTEELFRMYAKSYDSSKIGDKIMPFCNYIDGEFIFPSLKYLFTFRVLVCTSLTAGCLTRARKNPYFDSKHFTHVIIDECASTLETVSLVPIAGTYIKNVYHCLCNKCK